MLAQTVQIITQHGALSSGAPSWGLFWQGVYCGGILGFGLGAALTSSIATWLTKRTGL